MSIKYAAIVLTAVIGIAGCSSGGSSDKDEASSPNSPLHFRPYPIVVYDQADTAELQPHAERIAKLIDGVAQPGNQNPVTCIWLELTNWMPEGGIPGYIIINQAGGSVIQASDEQQMELAVERFEAGVEHHDNHVEIPLGLMTNYPIRQ